MAAIPDALSIHHFITSVGADVGFASIIGLALLVLLFFSQARETSTLRRRADEAEERVRSLEAYVDQLSRRTPVSAPVAAAPASAQVPARAVQAPVPSRIVAPEAVPAGAMAMIPAAPAGVGAPALSAATRLIPIADVDAISIRALKPSTNGVTTPSEPHPVPPPPSPPPSTAAGTGNGAGGPIAPPALGPAGAGAQNDSPAPRIAPRQGPPTVRPPAPPPRRAAAAPPPRRRMSRVIVALASLLGLAIVVVGVLVLTNSGGGSNAASSSAAQRSSSTTQTSGGQRTRHATTPSTTTVTPASVTVAVLNGTSTTNLAHDVMAKLTGGGYKPGAIATASDQTLNTTIVGYTQPAYRRDALAVAKSLNLGSASVQAVDPSDRTVACSSSPTSCSVRVVVTVGADLAANG
jgi:cytoskeletal protein RodZ